MNNIEILAPCGSYESVVAAVRKGADAVYIGALQFSARAFAGNFGTDELEKTIKYCHLHSVKVHIAINTLVSDSEIFNALDTAKTAYILGADAFIVQDLGLASLIRQSMPNAVLHASTQMSVHTPSAAKLLEKLGFQRVVLAREMSRQEIEEVVKSCNIETEVFVHGALCMCISGQCYLSAMLGGRSGNRGRCAQPCRLPFSVKNGGDHDLSLKDNCIINELSTLSEMGVTSAKIEGRMKRPEYVAAAVSACVESSADGCASDESLKRLQAVFSRSGFTDGYFFNRLGKEMFGTRSKDDVVSATDKILSEIRSEYKDEIQTNSVELEFTALKGKPSVLTAKCKNRTVTVTGESPETAQNKPLSDERVCAQLSKTGGTSFKITEVKIDIEDGIAMPASALNSLRRECLTLLEKELTALPEREAKDISKKPQAPHIKDKSPKFRASFRNLNIPDCFKECEYIYIPLFSDSDGIKRLIQRGFNVAAEIPRAFFGMEDKVKNALEKIKQLGINDVYCNNIGAAALAKELCFTVHGGFALNIFNSYSVEFYNKLGIEDCELSFELTASQINNIHSDIRLGIVGYGYLPLMITRNCPNKNGNGCKQCKGKSLITDRKGIQFTLMCSCGCTELLNSTPLVLSDKQDSFKTVDFISLRFTYESYSECERIFYDYKNKEKPSGKCTNGLYFRGVE